jgi:preprotein translocase subunit SecA
MEWAGMDEDTAIENSMVSKSIEGAQVKVEGYHFDMRKHLVDYDDVINRQREIIYAERRKILSGADLKANILTLVKAELKDIVEKHTGGDYEFEPDYKGLIAEVNVIMPLPPNFTVETLSKMKPSEIEDTLCQSAETLYNKREAEFGVDAMRILERLVMLRTMDSLWIEHLTAMEGMREGVGLEAVAQHDPLVTYKTRGHEMFEELMAGIQGDLARTIFHMAIRREPAPVSSVPARPVASTTGTTTAGVKTAPSRQVVPSPLAHVPQSPMAKVIVNNPGSVSSQPVKVAGKKVGRNDPCPCGSGKKYKHCCGK